MSYMMKMLQSFSNYLWPRTLHIITQLINHDKPLSTKYIFTKKKKKKKPKKPYLHKTEVIHSQNFIQIALLYTSYFNIFTFTFQSTKSECF